MWDVEKHLCFMEILTKPQLGWLHFGLVKYSLIKLDFLQKSQGFDTKLPEWSLINNFFIKIYFSNHQRTKIN